MFSTLQKLIYFRVKLLSLLYIFTLSFLHSSTLSDLNDSKKIPIKNSEIKWFKLKTNIEARDKTDLEWDLLEINDSKLFNKYDNFVVSDSKNTFSPEIRSFNRSIVFENEFIGPDLTFLVPIGFKSSDMMNVDFSIRGWNRRPPNSKFFAWNGGDAVGQIFVNTIKNNKSSFGLSFGIRSLYKGDDLPGGKTPIGEGQSMGFRWDYQFNEREGIALGAEQFVQFDDKTDTGRDMYLTYSNLGEQPLMLIIIINFVGAHSERLLLFLMRNLLLLSNIIIILSWLEVHTLLSKKLD